MNVLLLNGSPRANGCTFTALSEISKILNAENIGTEILQIGSQPVQDCIACKGCVGKGKCVFDDIANRLIEKAEHADGFIFGTPVYYAHPSGRILSALDRAFYAGGSAFEHKPAGVIACARRAGTTASVDVLSKYLGIKQMPAVNSSYWNMVHGNTPEELLNDLEGMQTIRNLAYNTAWLLKCIEAGKKAGITAPQNTTSVRTNFIR